MNEKIRKYVESKLNQIESENDAVAIISSFETAKRQMIFLNAAEDIICAKAAKESGRGVSFSDFSVLAHQIMMGQQEKVSQWGDKAYKLSERQVAVVASALFQMSKIQ